jgi:hemolysin activation/secretion protein
VGGIHSISNSIATSHYDSDSLTLSFTGTLADTLGAGGSNNGNVALTVGHLNLGGSPNQAADAASARTEGGFNKLRYSFSRTQAFDNAWSLYMAYSGQWADANLDSSEKFYLGGANGVRAYPANEAGGAMGQLINLELRWHLPQGFLLSGFYDIGDVLSNRNNNFTGASAQNELLLRGVGFALAWRVNPSVNLKSTWAQRIGDNPNRTANGTDQDGTRVFDRFWLNASVTF